MNDHQICFDKDKIIDIETQPKFQALHFNQLFIFRIYLCFCYQHELEVWV